MSSSDWDPAQYLRYADHRTRPGIELMARIRAVTPRNIVDLGCGTGNLTTLLHERWPNAHVVGVDSSPKMIEHARNGNPDLDWVLSGIEDWHPNETIDVIYSNATLHWVDDHASLFGRLADILSPGGALAVQMPDNWSAPTHLVPAQILDSGNYSDMARASLMRDRVSPPERYQEWLQPLAVDMWRTTYYQRLTGQDAVWEWVTGSVLRPVLAVLEAAERRQFEADVKAGYREAYPTVNGVTVLPFSRLFMVATRPE